MRKSPTSIYIVSPATDSDGSVLKYETAFPALAPLALGTWLQKRLPDLDVVAREGNISGQTTILEEITREKPSVVAVSTLGMNYQHCLEIAECAKSVDSIVVFGNDHAAQLSYQILTARPMVDYIICSDYGELSLELLLKNLSGGTPALEDIPFLTYRRPTGEVSGYRYLGREGASTSSFIDQYMHASPQGLRKRKELDIFPVTDRTLYSKEIWQHCLENFRQQSDISFLQGNVTGVTTMNRARGCSRAKRPCSFCNILSLTPRFSSPEIFWEEIAAAYEDISANVFYEVCDSFTSFPSFIKELLDARPPLLEVEPQLIVYGQALEIARCTSLPSMLKDLGVFKVNLGLESGCDTTLRHMKGPHDNTMVNRKALEILRSSDLRVYSSFVLGSEVETRETLYQTRDWIRSIIDDDLVDDIEVQPVLPYIGNREGQLLADHGLFHVDPANPDWPPDTDSLSRLFIDSFSGVSYSMVRDVAASIIDYAEEHEKTGFSAVMRNNQ